MPSEREIEWGQRRAYETRQQGHLELAQEEKSEAGGVVFLTLMCLRLWESHAPWLYIRIINDSGTPSQILIIYFIYIIYNIYK